MCIILRVMWLPILNWKKQNKKTYLHSFVWWTLTLYVLWLCVSLFAILTDMLSDSYFPSAVHFIVKNSKANTWLNKCKFSGEKERERQTDRDRERGREESARGREGEKEGREERERQREREKWGGGGKSTKREHSCCEALTCDHLLWQTCAMLNRDVFNSCHTCMIFYSSLVTCTSCHIKYLSKFPI